MNQNSYSNSIAHHGVKGQRWGVRRYQNDDGSLTAAGKKRQAKQEVKAKKALTKAKARYREVTANKRKASCYCIWSCPWNSRFDSCRRCW